MRTTKRLQFRVTGEYVDVLDDLKERINASSRSDVVKTAISILKWVIDNMDKEYRIVAISEDHGTEVEIYIPGSEIISKPRRDGNGRKPQTLKTPSLSGRGRKE